MSGPHPGEQGPGTFGTIDPKLTVFALANGMDLAKGDGYRRLEWFHEGLERGILIEARDAALRVSALRWRTGRLDELTEAEVGSPESAEALMPILERAIVSANAL